LTVVATGIDEALARLEPDHPARPFLLDVAAAAPTLRTEDFRDA